ncbi:hypothetical protein [Citrobacter sp. JGM124]|uniref:hypothetical protein n=1 Tax=Citrobacter sp. JGM124 TaxID=2799789 RepID=UPI001BA854C5|nr:hypothetical protein [Citrobacter sp. JGM124]MBS0846911.1 hypothetical protein [Citrobacter sp. JGM124]
MMTEDNQMMNILYAPLSYTHSDNLSSIYPSMEILTDVILNHWIITKYHLDDLPDVWKYDNPISTILISNWYIIPKISYFIGGYILRERLILDNSVLMSDLQLLSFISLPLRHSVQGISDYKNINYATFGAAFILGIAKNFPIALKQRLHLFFPSDMDFPKIKISITPDNINLLKMAIIYARNSNK